MSGPGPADLGRRAAAAWFPLLFVALFAWLDWITHRSVVFLVVVGGGTVAVILFRERIVERLKLGPTLAQVPARLRPLLLALPPLLYFVVRGQGTSDAGIQVLLASIGMILAISFLGPGIDRRLSGFYGRRNRWMPRPARMLLAPVTAILLAFLVVHGTLSDLPALFGGATNSPASPSGRTGRIVLGTLLSGAFAFLLLREAPR